MSTTIHNVVPFHHFLHLGLLLLQSYCQLPNLLLQIHGGIVVVASIVQRTHFQVNVIIVVITVTRSLGW